jgi:hypothetical protein
MDNDQTALTRKQPDNSCHLCGKQEDLISEELCRGCLSKSLLSRLPRLKHTLEMRYGAKLDTWLAGGTIYQSSWAVTADFQVNRDRIKSLLKDVIRKAVESDDLRLSLTDENWKPIQLDHLMAHIYEQCVDELQQVITRSLLDALSTAPTTEAERELIEVASGKRRVRKRYVREEAVIALASSKSTPMLLPARALIEMRYLADKGKELYTELVDGKISSVWEEVRDSLPEEIAKLISTDDTF